MKNKNFYKIIIVSFVSIIISSIINYDIYNILNKLIWIIAIFFIFIGGFYFSSKLKFIQVKFITMIKYLLKNKSKKGDISTFESLSMTLAAQIGVGSIAGVSLAIYLGGPGVVFWMWVSGIISSVNSLVESILGVLFQEKDYDNVYKGGPSYYIKKGLKSPKLSLLYAIIILLAYIVGFITIQSNTIVNVTSTYIDKNIVLLVLCITSGYIILKDVKSIAKFSSIIVPVMGIIYILFGVYVIYNNINILDKVISTIISSAFNLKTGIIGFITPIILGIQRGIFACESGIGTSAISSATTHEKPIKEGFMQVFGVHFTVLVICTITALVILCSDYQFLNIANPNGIEITSYAFSHHAGSVGSIILTIVTILFAYSTIISGYYYGESNLKFLFNNISKKNLIIFKLLTVVLLFIGGIISPTIIWNIIRIIRFLYRTGPSLVHLSLHIIHLK